MRSSYRFRQRYLAWSTFSARHVHQGERGRGGHRLHVFEKSRVSAPRDELKPAVVVAPRDQIVHEAMRVVLGSAFAPRLRNSPQSFHAALKQVKTRWSGNVTWLLDFDASHKDLDLPRLLSILKEEIDDPLFFDLLFPTPKGALAAGPLFPPGRILTPLLCNIYFSKLDQEVERIRREYETPAARKPIPPWRSL